MTTKIKIAQWNSNGIANYKNELELFLKSREIVIMLISETHLTLISNFKIHGYTSHANNHPDDKPCGGTAILIKKNESVTIASQTYRPDTSNTLQFKLMK